VWSPDGRRIYVGVRSMESSAFYRLAFVRSDGTGRLNFTTNDRTIRPESFRPDGSVLAFDFMRSGDRWERTGVIHRDGTGRRAVGPTNLWNSTWRPNTRTLAVSRVLRDDGSGVTVQVQLVSTRTGRFHPLAVTQSAGAYGVAYPLGWSKDGSHLFYEHFSYRNGDQVDPRIYRIRADGTGRTDLTPSHLVGWYGEFSVQGR
jgi:Tol biopolymer transport system component